MTGFQYHYFERDVMAEGLEYLGDVFEFWTDKLQEWSVELYKDHRLHRDYEVLRAEIEAEMPPVGGVALKLYIGMKPSENNKYIPEYLGLQILGPALSLGGAKVEYQAKATTATRSPLFPGQCKITDAYSGPTIGPDKSKASTPGLQAALVRYAEVNPNNLDTSGGLGIVMLGYVKSEIVFVGRNFLRGKKR